MEYYHLSQLIRRNAEKYGDEEAIKVRDEFTQSWHSVSWNEFFKKVMSVAEALCHTGVAPQSNVGIYSQNMAECLYVDFGIFANRAVAIPMYATASIPQITYIINEAEIELLFVGEQWQYDNAWQVMKESLCLKQIVIFDKKVTRDKEDKISVYFDNFSSPKNRTSHDITTVEKRTKEAQDSDLAHIIYTSGTTGEPKGVMLTHANYKEVLKIHDIRLNYLPQRFLSISFLPLAHVFEKAWSIYCIHRGCSLAISLDPKEIQTYIKEIRPQAMCSVPRFWEKVYVGVKEKIDSSNFLLKAVFSDAIRTGKKYNLQYKNQGKKASWFLKMKFNFYDKTIYNTLKKVIGIEKGLIFPAAGATLSNEINVFLQSVNIPLVYGYGLTETVATVSCFPPIDFEIGTVGKVMPDIEVRIGENNEIQIKGKTIMQGYYKKPKETAEAFTSDGFFRTGDAGSLTDKMGIVLTERIKELYKTSNGKYIAPQQLEARLIVNRYIDTAFIIADQRKFVSALIVPAFEEVENYAKQHQIPFDSPKSLYEHAKIQELFKQHIDAIQNEFASYEQIKRFALLPYPFSIQSGELTNTLKMKRAFIAEKYKETIDNIYDENY
jgi:long-chain acyl-CoA synthetase